MEQNVNWLGIPIAPGKARTFSVRARVSPEHPTGPVAISTLVYVLNGDQSVNCASAMEDATVRGKVDTGGTGATNGTATHTVV